MNYYDARERKTASGNPSGRWDYTCMNDGQIWPVGYCRAFSEPSEIMLISESERERLRSFAHKHHIDGHDTADEARECYRQYLLDQRLNLHNYETESQHKCVVCGAWTGAFAEVNHQIFVLCDEHRTREQVDKLLSAPGYIISSY